MSVQTTVQLMENVAKKNLDVDASKSPRITNTTGLFSFTLQHNFKDLKVAL
jgi:hypothetical protein